MNEAWNGGIVRGATGRFRDDRVFADRVADGFEPLFPRVGMLWFQLGVQQQRPA
ncbi:MAG: hypothetical protein ACRDR6_03995 [Pseudonocardiaceae bacterium]